MYIYIHYHHILYIYMYYIIYIIYNIIYIYINKCILYNPHSFYLPGSPSSRVWHTSSTAGRHPPLPQALIAESKVTRLQRRERSSAHRHVIIILPWKHWDLTQQLGDFYPKTWGFLRQNLGILPKNWIFYHNNVGDFTTKLGDMMGYGDFTQEKDGIHSKIMEMLLLKHHGLMDRFYTQELGFDHQKYGCHWKNGI